MELSEKFQAARMKLDMKRPYLRSVLYGLIPIPKEIGTFGVDDSGRLYYDERLVEKWTVDEIATVLYHECGHILRNHSGRFEATGFATTYEIENPDNVPEEKLVEIKRMLAHQKFNICGDAEMNDDIDEEGFKFPVFPIDDETKKEAKKLKIPDDRLGKAVFPESIPAPRGLCAEEYYHLLKPNQKTTLIVCSGDCGSGADGQQRDYEDPKSGNPKNPQETKGLTPIDMDLIRKKCAEDIQNHQKSRGDVPAGLLREANNILNPVVDWKKELRSVFRRIIESIVGNQEPSYVYRSRRQYLYPNIVIPGMIKPVINVGLIQDTSGSMSEEESQVCYGEVKGLLKHLPRVYFMGVDTEAYGKRWVVNPNQIELKGWGGTDMRVGMEAMAAIKPKINICILVTDGDTPWPDYNQFSYKTIIVLTAGDREVPAWARKIVINQK